MSPKARTQFLLSASILATGVAILAVTVFHTPTARAQAGGITLPARWEYVAKFACGNLTASATPPSERNVNIGNYTTVVNLHNPAATLVAIQKQVEVAYPETYPNTVVTDPTQRFADSIPSNHTMSVNCTEIVNLLKINGTPAAGTFFEGYLMIDSFSPAGVAPSAAPLDVVEITTAAQNTQSPVVSHDLLTVPGRSLPAGIWPF
jgi:hypothetical protein